MIKRIIVCLFAVYFCIAGLTSCKKDSGLSYNASAPIIINSFTPLQGSGGTEILINGANFTTDTGKISVTLNGKPLKIVGTNGTQLIAVVPKKAGSGPITITIGGTNVTSVDTFNYLYTRTVTTLAGNGTAGFANGKGTDAMFSFSGESWYRSMGLAVDDNLNVYVADPGNHCIRKIDSLGNVTTLAGNPSSSGYADGKGSAAKFSIPYDVALDAAGNVYSVDPGNWDLRKITPDGTATTWAWGAQETWSVAVDKTSGTVYYSGCTSPGKVYPVTAQWATGDPIVTDLNYPAGIAFDNAGNLYVSINGDNVVKKYAAGTWQGSIIAGQAGSAGYENGSGTTARFDHPWGLTVDNDGNVYVAGNGTWDGGTYNTDQSIRYITAGSWLVSTFAGSGNAGFTDAVGAAASFNAPTGVAVDKNGVVYVLDKNNNRVRKIVSE